jgi:3-(3-hydroxy-phenyl)propionate hydroxylase
MIDLSVTAGNVLAPPKRWHGAVRDGVSWLLNYIPPVKRYFLEMRFKPMPQYHVGALVREGDARTSPVGKMFIQPKVTLESGEVTLLDNVIGPNFAVIGWGCNPLGHERVADPTVAGAGDAFYPGRAGYADTYRSG